MILLQGAEDEVVPPPQAEIMVEALEAQGLPHAYLPVRGRAARVPQGGAHPGRYEAELSFYAQVLGFELGDPIPKVAIRNL